MGARARGALRAREDRPREPNALSEAPLHFALAKVLGLKPMTIGDGRCVWAVKVDDVHRNPYGAVHGGILFTLIDYAMGGALTSTLETGRRCTTIEIKINYVASVAEGELRAEAWVVSKGARIAVMEGKVTAGETLLAMATGTFYMQGARPYTDPPEVPDGR